MNNSGDDSLLGVFSKTFHNHMFILIVNDFVKNVRRLNLFMKDFCYFERLSNDLLRRIGSFGIFKHMVIKRKKFEEVNHYIIILLVTLIKDQGRELEKGKYVAILGILWT